VNIMLAAFLFLSKPLTFKLTSDYKKLVIV
jgi:hypothetical protein